MITQTLTQLSLFQWAKIIGISPYLLAQIGEPRDELARYMGVCRKPYYQSAFQDAENITREDIGDVILNAEARFKAWRNWHPSPIYIEDEEIIYPRSFARDRWQGTLDQRYYGKPVQTECRKLIAIGSEVLTYIGTYAVNETKLFPGDSFNTGFDVTVLNEASSRELTAFFIEADRGGFEFEACEIRPLKKTDDGTDSTLSGERVQLTRPANYDLTPEPLNATSVGTFATEVDVYRRTTDTTDIGTYTQLLGCPSELTTTINQARIADSNGGWVRPRAYDVCVLPDKLTLNYLSGYGLDGYNRMNDKIAKIIAYAAAGMLPTRPCGCQQADNRLDFFRELPMTDDNQMKVTPEIITDTLEVWGYMSNGTLQAYVQGARLD